MERGDKNGKAGLRILTVCKALRTQAKGEWMDSWKVDMILNS